MKKTKRLAALIAIAAIVILITAFVISAFTATPGEFGGRFIALLYCVVALPILAWLIMFCVGKMQGKRESEEMFSEDKENRK